MNKKINTGIKKTTQKRRAEEEKRRRWKPKGKKNVGGKKKTKTSSHHRRKNNWKPSRSLRRDEHKGRLTPQRLKIVEILTNCRTSGERVRLSAEWVRIGVRTLRGRRFSKISSFPCLVCCIFFPTKNSFCFSFCI